MSNSFRFSALAVLSVLIFAAPHARGAGLIVTDDGGLLEIQEHHVTVTINNGIAVTRVTQIFLNTENRVAEGVYTFPVPLNASVAGFSMWVDGREMIGEVIEKQAAREIYYIEKARQRDPGLLEQSDYRTFNFRVTPIAPHALQRVQVTYYQELDCDGQWTTYVYPLASNTRQVVNSRVSKSFDITFDAKSPDAILEMRSPSHPAAVSVKQYSDTYSRATLTALGGGLDRDVVIAYRTAAGPTSARLTAYRDSDSDGYFCLTLTANEPTKPEDAGADYLFLLDVSGSMRDDDKLRQSRGTLSSLLEMLSPDDYFDVLSFNTAPSPALGQLEPANDLNRKKSR